ncbi:MAG: hypothetical protein WA002_01535 [Candidatus Acidiferrales bacterium]
MTLVVGAAIMCTAVPAFAQNPDQGSSPQSNQNQDNSQNGGQATGQTPGQKNPNGAASTDDNSAQQDQPATQEAPVPAVLVAPTYQTQINTIGSANPLSSLGAYHWGPLFLGTSDVRGIVDTIKPAPGFGPAQQNIVTLVDTTILFEKDWRQSRLAVQYMPRVAVDSGQVAYDYLNQSASVDTYFPLSSRWLMGITDHFTSSSSQGLAGGVFADANAVTASTLQTNFLDSSETWIYDTFAIPFSYEVNANTTLTLSPEFVYAKTSGISESEGGDISTIEYGANAMMTHAVSARTSIGFTYMFRQSEFTAQIPTSDYQTFWFNAAHQFAPTFGITGQIGLTYSSYNGGSGYWTTTGTASIFKTFHRSSISLLYSRGQSTFGYVTNALTDRADAIVRYQLFQRLSLVGDAGYQRQLSSIDSVNGKYASTEIDYTLTRTLFGFASYAYKFQNGANNPQLYDGVQTFASIGLRWDPNVGER